MKKQTGFVKNVIITLFLLCLISSIHAQTSVDAETERPAIENRLNQYSKYLLAGDSVSLAAMYATDGMMGCAEGAEILSFTGRWVRSAIKGDTRHVTFKSTTLTTDGELLVETGKAEGRSDSGELKYTFRYLVVWKKEDGFWKLYRDIGL